jgi:hypothetical protein
MKECQIKGRYVEEEESKSINYLNDMSKKRLKGKKSKSVSSNTILDKSKCNCDNNESIRQINYVIEIDDPYLHKCYIKSNNLFDSMDFYNQVLNVL